MSYANGIGNLQQALSSIVTTGPKPAGATNVEVKSEGSGEGVDQAQLSSVGGIVAQALAGSDVRSAKVASLQQAIASGNYNVSSSDVADKMMQALLG